MKKLLIASTSTIHASTYLEYLMPILKGFFKNTEEILFIPYARPSGLSYTEYTKKVNKIFAKIGVRVRGIHEFDSPSVAITNAQAIFVGGGNTFVLVKELQDQNLFKVLKEKIAAGTPYLGTSAGSNICGFTMQTTNDMPIVFPKSYQTLGVVPFNINAHYLDPDPNSTHRGETRETRIKEFHSFNDIPVLGLREGSWLEVNGKEIFLRGELQARWFEQNKSPVELNSNSKLVF